MFRFLFAALFFLLPTQAFALAGNWSHNEGIDIRLISGTTATGTENTVPLGLEIQLGNEWHTYWRSPGEAGLPPQLDWSRSQTDANNLQSATLLYPAPRRYTAYGMETIGYRDHIVLPIDATLRTAGQALTADVAIDLLICSSICVPKHFDLTLTVPAGAATESAEAPLLRQARELLPTDSEHSGLLLKGIASDGQSLSFSIASRARLTEPDIFVENAKNIGFGAPQVQLDAQGHSATLKVKLLDNLSAGTTLTHLPVTLTIVNGTHATEIKVFTPATTSAPSVYVPEKPPFYLAWLFALLGGFILNLMPCVLPVLSLKIISVISHGGGDEHRVRQSFVMTAAGIMFSFIVLACTMVLLQRFGLALGWGVQFQQPAFLMFLVLLLTFFAANLWGLFEITLPRFLADRMDTSYHPKLAGDFATGAFATLLATPCSAPFLGTAVGFALASGPKEIFAIFTALGFGMGAPYLAVAFFPHIATALPKPGAWMIHLRRFLAIALAFTALWLIWILSAQITVAYAQVFGLLMIAVALLLCLGKSIIPRRWAAAGIGVLCLIALILGLNGALKPKPAPEMDRQWIPFNQLALDADIAEGKTVFLDVTADWCLTCKANMKFTLSNPEVIQRLFHSQVIAMQADWTNPDPVVIELLHKHGRYGIPFNAVFGPNAPQGIILPELMSPEGVIKALDEASKTTP